MGRVGFLPNTVAVNAMASMMATGVSASLSVTSPMAYMLSTLVFEYSSTCMAPFFASVIPLFCVGSSAAGQLLLVNKLKCFCRL